MAARPRYAWENLVTLPLGSNAVKYASPGNLAGPAGGAEVMAGMNVTFTPTATGRLLVMTGIQIIAAVVTAGAGLQARLSYGTGAAPVNGAALTGTQLGTLIAGTTQSAAAAAGDVSIPLSIFGVIIGLVVNTQYWIDLSIKVPGSGVAGSIANSAVAIIEI